MHIDMPDSGRTSAQLAEMLSRISPFSALDAAVLGAIARAGHVRALPKGALLFSKGDLTDAVYVVCAGVVALVLSTPDGRELVIGEMHAGDCFGELAALTDQRRSTGATAQTACELFVLPTWVFVDVVESQPALMRQLLAMTARRLRECSDRENALAFLDAPGRLARALLLLHRQAADPGGVIVISQEDLAQRVGLTRQTVAKELGVWRRAGWLTTRRGRIELRNLDALRHQAAAAEA